MTQLNTIRASTSLLLFLYTSFVHGQDADPAWKRDCRLYKRTVFEELVPISFFFANAPVTWESIDSCHGSRPLIVGGKPAEPKEFAPMARLGNRNKENKTNWFCGGTLISEHLVLTAAHCFYAEQGAVNVVRLGELDFATDNDDADPEDFGVLNVTEHPNYNYPLLYDDIGILRLDRAVNFTVYKHPACLPISNGDNDENFIAIGWGDKKFAGKESTKLLKVQLQNFGSRCPKQIAHLEDLPNGYNATTQLCIGSRDRKDTCNGDSGGPLLTYHEDYPCMYHVMGITSAGIGCDTPNEPSFYTRVHFYLNWIQQEVDKKVKFNY